MVKSFYVILNSITNFAQVIYLKHVILLMFYYRTGCILGSCMSKVANMSRHLAQCHKNLTKKGREDVLALHQDLKNSLKEKENLEIVIKDGRASLKTDEENYEAKKKTYTRKKRKCPICGNENLYMYSHLVNKHKMDRSSEEYRKTLQSVSSFVNK